MSRAASYLRRRASRAGGALERAALAVGPVEAGVSRFMFTGGAFSLLDAVRHCLEACAPARVSVWTWRITDYEIGALAGDERISSALLVVDQSIQSTVYAGRGGTVGANGLALLAKWRARFGAGSVRMVVNHAKVATVEGNGLRVLLRGSLNFNESRRCEQIDVTEGGEDFALVRRMEDELEEVPDDAAASELARVSRLGDRFDAATMPAFAGLKRWEP